jgi:hypothetical protein
MAVPTTEAGVAILITSDSDQGQLPERRAGRRQRKSRLEPTLGGANRRHTLLRYTSLFGLLALVLNPATRNGGSKQAARAAGRGTGRQRRIARATLAVHHWPAGALLLADPFLRENQTAGLDLVLQGANTAARVEGADQSDGPEVTLPGQWLAGIARPLPPPP